MGHPYRSPPEPTVRRRRTRHGAPSDAILLLAILLVGVVPVVDAVAGDAWNAQASMGMAMVLFAAWNLVGELRRP